MVKAPTPPVVDMWLLQEPQSSWTEMALYNVKVGAKDSGTMATMEVVRSSFEALPGRMNANIVVLLDHVCQPERLFAQIVHREVQDIEETHTSYEKCLQRAKSTRSTELQYLLEAGIGLVQLNPGSLELTFVPDAYLSGEIARCVVSRTK
ncbi:hypothetical protein DUNSADRAFT_13086 [Dunaliella salina]|uniref:RNA-dependent RNA polymerase n=1 Tax=Dunaliella salina TaxID=3046 RepID=A0ABQ7H3M2_DUNSA|nr:hypothetical protein DUNSADRAFT_13086 [Dunaliella salina]|eukprot:KAF5841423.1 hypothetical protein DUNSADRAFT_13086 [Dunaliella salina]